jgi:hypothetical protein
MTNDKRSLANRRMFLGPLFESEGRAVPMFITVQSVKLAFVLKQGS